MSGECSVRNSEGGDKAYVANSTAIYDETTLMAP